MAESVTVSILFARALVESVERAGIDRRAFLSGTRLSAAMLEDASSRVPMKDWADAIERALNVTGDEALGLHMGEHVSAPMFGLFAQLVSHATTVRDAIASLSNFHRLVSDVPQYTLQEEGGRAVLVYEGDRVPPRPRRLLSELTLTGLFRMVRYFRYSASPYEVAFAHRAPAHENEYRRVFGGLERFGRPFTGLVFDRRLLDAAQDNVDADLRAALHAHAEARAIVLDDRRTYAMRVRAYLASREDPGALDMNDVARALGMSARSLRRRLHEEGASWHALMEAARAEVARNLIRGSASIQHVASTLGFANPTAFHHAFKRWTGMTPSEFRRRSLEDG